nr:unnamed protein product [Digitaria exilis]
MSAPRRGGRQRNILATVTSRLSGGGGGDEVDLHRRCVLFDCAPSRVRIDAVRAARAPSSGRRALRSALRGPAQRSCHVVPPLDTGIEIPGIGVAVALCGYFFAAVVVFRTAAAAESALRGPARRSCHAVPPLDVGIEIPGIGPTDVKIIPDLPVPEPCAPPTSPEEEDDEPTAKPLQWFTFRDPWAEANGPVLPPGTRRFHPSFESLAHGPTRGADGSLWMHGEIAILDERGREVGVEHDASLRVRRTDPPPKDKRRPLIPDTAIWFEPF